jgi:hypothetical protein
VIDNPHRRMGFDHIQMNGRIVLALEVGQWPGFGKGGLKPSLMPRTAERNSRIRAESLVCMLMWSNLGTDASSAIYLPGFIPLCYWGSKVRPCLCIL